MLQFILRVFIDKLLVVGDDGLGDSLSDGVYLGSVSTTGNSDADIDVGESFQANNQEGFVDLESQDFRLDKVERLSVDLDDPFTSLFPYSQCVSSTYRIVLPHRSNLAVGDGGSCSRLGQCFQII